MRQSAKLAQGGARHTSTGNSLRNSIPDPGCAVDDVVQVEAPSDGPVLIDEDVEDALAAVLLHQELAVALRISLIEIVAAVIDEPGEVRPIRQLKGTNRIHVIATNTLKLAHTGQAY